MSVYFITCREVNAVKIGHSVEPHARLPEIQLGCPIPLKLEGIMPGGHEDEQRLHKWFSDDRLRGEWFTLTPMLEELIRANRAGPPPDHDKTARANSQKAGTVAVQPRHKRQAKVLAAARIEEAFRAAHAPRAFEARLLGKEHRKRIAAGDITFPFRAKVSA